MFIIYIYIYIHIYIYIYTYTYIYIYIPAARRAEAARPIILLLLHPEVIQYNVVHYLLCIISGSSSIFGYSAEGGAVDRGCSGLG